MKSKKMGKILSLVVLSTILVTGVEGMAPLKSMANIPTVAYAQTVKFNDSFNPNKYGVRTDMGWITEKVTLKDNMPNNGTIEQLKAMSVEINPTDNPEYFHYWKNPISGEPVLDINEEALQLTDTIYYWHNVNKYNITVDRFVKILDIKRPTDNTTGPTIVKTYAKCQFSGGEKAPAYCSPEGRKNVTEYINQEQNKILYDEQQGTLKPTEPTEPTKKVYTSKRLAGANRYSTASAIANEYANGSVNTVIIASALDFPDALVGSTLAAQVNAPILLVNGHEDDEEALNYMKAHLNKAGKVYILGGTSAVKEDTVNKIKALGYNNVERLAGLNRYSTNMEIVDEMNVKTGSDVVIAYGKKFADSLSISGIAGAKGMPIFLTEEDYISDEIINKIKAIKPNNIYIVGGTTVVSQNIQNKLSGLGKVERLGGLNRYETSLAIANKFSTKDANAVIATGLDFPDALTGSVLASKLNAPVVLVNKYESVSSQKEFFDKTSINNLYFLGGTSVISDNAVNELTK